MRYFFNKTGAVYDPNNQGVELADHDHARVEAVRYAGQIMRDEPTLIWQGEDFRIEVTDDNRMLLFTVIVIGVDSPSTTGR